MAGITDAVFKLEFLLAFLCVDLAIIAYFFYLNRLLGLILTVVLRFLYSGQGEESIWVDIGSIHFSLPSARILFKDVSYHSSNQTVKIVKGQISWRYWIRRPSSEQELGNGHVNFGAGGKQTQHDRCRLQVSLEGFEWFLYNRTPSYEDILRQMQTPPQPDPAMDTSSATQEESPSGENAPFLAFFPRHAIMPRVLQSCISWVKTQLPYLDPKDILPIGIDVRKGKIICGNHATPSLLVAEFAMSDGKLGVTQARSRFDLHKQVLSFRFKRVLVRFVHNDEYKESMVTTGQHIHLQMSALSQDDDSPIYSYSVFHKLWKRFQLGTTIFSHNKPRNAPAPSRKKSLDYHNPYALDMAEWEYAIERKILETSDLELCYYTDVVGDVPFPDDHTRGFSGIGNGPDTDPEWGIDLIVQDGVVRYGPWADRQRAELQRVFFPPTYHDSEKSGKLHPGDKRVWTHLQVFVELRGETALQIPFREPSKDWMWDAKCDYPLKPRHRDAAYIHVSAADMSSITYVMPMITTTENFESRFELHLDSPVITSSLNDIQLVNAESCRVRGELPSPLKWNAEREWTIAASLRQSTLYLLRDHINMFTDLGKDWSSGPPTQYNLFVPTTYAFELDLHQFDLTLYLNDQNIIDKPRVREDNALLTLRGPKLKLESTIPSNVYRPDTTSYAFTVDIPGVSVNLSLPRWHTHALYTPKGGYSVAHCAHFALHGSYLINSQVAADSIDQLKLDIALDDVAVNLTGWIVRYFMVLRENYLGSFTHFSTLYEYLDNRARGLPLGDPVDVKHRAGTSNMLQVELGLCVQNVQIVLPAGLPGLDKSDGDQASTAEDIGSCLLLATPELQLQLRLHDHYMDMSLNVDTISGYIERRHSQVAKMVHIPKRKKEALVLDGIDIVANRLFGPQPHTTTYLCIWELNFGHLKLMLSPTEARILEAVASAFKLNSVDAPNIPADQYQVAADPDITFLKVSLVGVDVTLCVDQAAFTLSLPSGLRLHSNDLAGDLYSKILNVKVPEIAVKLLTAGADDPSNWYEAASLDLDVNLDLYSSPVGWREASRAQNEFIMKQDAFTNRAKMMFDELSLGANAGRTFHLNGLHLPQPHCAPPAQSNGLPGDTITVSAVQPSFSSTLSGSDNEDAVNEAERDARVAHMRSLTPVPRVSVTVDDDDEDSMSSGDESDDADLSEADSLDSFWSDIDPSDSQFKEKQLMFRYSRLTRRYAARFSHGPQYWHDNPLKLTHDCRLWDYPENRAEKDSTDRQPTPSSSTPLCSYEDTSVSLIRFTSRSGIELRLTPLILSVADHFVEPLAESVLSHELRLDGILESYISDFGPPKPASTILLDLAIAFVRVRVMQSGVRDVYDPTPEFADSNIETILAQLSLTDIRCSSGFVDDPMLARPPSVYIAFNECSLSFFAVPSPKHGHYSPFKKLPLRASISKFCCNMHDDVTDVRWDGTAVEMDHLGPECALVIFKTTSNHGTQLMESVDRWKAQVAHQTEHLLQDVLELSANIEVIDPLSTIQPLYLVQSGRPNELRTDTTFRFLLQLRYSLLGAATMPSRSEYNGFERLSQLLETRLASLAIDNEGAQIPALAPILPRLKKPRRSPKFFETPARWGSVEATRMRLNIYNAVHTSSTEFTLSRMSISAGIRHLDLIQQSASNVPSYSQTSLREPADYTTLKATVSVAFGDTRCIILPDMLNFAQQLVRTHKAYLSSSTKQSSQDMTSPKVKADDASTKRITEAISVDLTVAVAKFHLQAVAASLIVEFGSDAILATASAFSKTRKISDASLTHNTVIQLVYLRALSKQEQGNRRNTALASLEVKDTKINVGLRPETKAEAALHVLFGVKSTHLTVPKSALRLYRFAEEWRADFLPGIEAMAQALLSEIKADESKISSPNSAKTSTKKASPHMHIHINGRIDSFGIFLQVMRGTWLSWEVRGITLHAQGQEQILGLHAQYQIYSIENRAASPQQRHSRVKVELPAITLNAKRADDVVHLMLLVDFFRVKIKPSHWDALLSVQQKFGKDFNELIQLVQETRSKNLSSQPANTSQKPKIESSLHYKGALKMKGFRIGLEAPSSVISLECHDVGGRINNLGGQSAFLKLSDLALSLAPRSAQETQGFNRGSRTAFVIIDFHVNVSGDLLASAASISVTKIHAVMQPIAIGQFGDFIDHIQAEMMERKEQRAVEIAEFKEKTKSVIRTFESKSIEDTSNDQMEWLQRMTIDIRIEDIGVAFPLSLNQELELPKTGSIDNTAVRAFLFSVASLSFSSHKGVTGTADMAGFSFQFVSHFRQSVPSDYSGYNHLTNNRLLYPEMKANVRLDHSDVARNAQVDSQVNGFILDLDASLPDYVFSLIDVYQEGKQRVEKLGESISWPIEEHSEAAASTTQVDMAKHYMALPISTILLSLTFYSGELRMHSETTILARKRKPSRSVYDQADDILQDEGVELFKVPVVTVWGEYRGKSVVQKLGLADADTTPAALMFKSTVHSSENTFRPTILPFISDIMHRVEARLRQASRTRPSPPPVQPLEVPHTIAEPSAEPSPAVSSLQISFSLRIDQSRLQLSCQPDVNVIAALNWNSGGFIFNVSPGARSVTLTASVDGLTAGLKHGFLSEDCVRIDARNLAFSVNFSKSDPSSEVATSSVSVVLDTEFSGLVRFTRLQDVLCFKAVWLERIPILNANANVTTEARSRRPSVISQPSTTSAPAAPTSHNTLTTMLLLRVRHIRLEVDLGQSISAISVDFNNAVMRTKLSEAADEFTLTVAQVDIVARGNVSGKLDVPNFIFSTVRRKDRSGLSAAEQARLLDLFMTSGALRLNLQSDHQPLLQYHAEPLVVKSFDDWSSAAPSLQVPDSSPQERPLHVSFLVSGTAIAAAITVGAIPRLMSYLNKFKSNLEAQKEGASLESKAFRIATTPKPENPLTDVANAMLHSARSRFKEASAELEYIIRQQMSLNLDVLKLAVFPRSMSDHEIAQFVGRNVQASLMRVVGGASKAPTRDLSLAFSSLAISRFSGIRSQSDVLENEDTLAWLDRLIRNASEANIVGLPSMNMHMASEEVIESPNLDADLGKRPTRQLVYDFNSTFIRSAEGKRDIEDIYITLNVALYSWLTVLRKNFTREMGQVRAVEDWRSAATNVASVASAGAPNTALANAAQTASPASLLGTPLTRKVKDSENRGSSLPPNATVPLDGAQYPGPNKTPSMDMPSAASPPTIYTSPPAPNNGINNNHLDANSPCIPDPASPTGSISTAASVTYRARTRRIERLTMRQLGEATPDVMHPFFMKTAGFNLEETLPQYVHEYATSPLEEIMEVLLRLYTRQLLSGGGRSPHPAEG